MGASSDDRYKILFDHSADAMLIIEGERFIDFNDATLNMLGYETRDELFSKHPSELSPPYQPDGQPSFQKANAMIEAALRDGSNRFEWVHTRADGEAFPVEVLLTAIPYQGQTMLHVVWRDITKRLNFQRELELHRNRLEQLVDEKTHELREARDEAEQLSKTKTNFFRNMSHELRTPLNAIIGFSDTIKNEIFGPIGHEKYREYIADVSASADHLLALINDILDVSAIEENKLSLYEETVKWSDVSESTLRMVEPQGRKHHVSLSLENRCPEDVHLIVDTRRMKQVLLNLLSNAIKFTDPGGRVVLRALIDPETGAFSFSVEDTGSGMSPQELQTALEQFGQVERTKRPELHGTGLGLPLTVGLVRLHDGHFDIESESGKGTSVFVRLPAHRVITPTEG